MGATRWARCVPACGIPGDTRESPAVVAWGRYGSKKMKESLEHPVSFIAGGVKMKMMWLSEMHMGDFLFLSEAC